MKVLQIVVPILGLLLLVAGCDTDPMLDALLDNIEETPVTEKVSPPLNREAILAFPGEDATPEEFNRHAELVIAASVNVNLLDISGCTPNPLVIEVGYGESIEIKNSDTTDHTLKHAGASITIPAGSSRGVVLTQFLESKGGDGFAGYACDDAMGGIFYINARLTVKPSERQRYNTFKVVDFLFPDGRKNPSLEGVTVTTLEGIEVTKKTASDGSVTFKRDLPLTVRLEKEGYLTTEVTVTEADEEILLPSPEKNITFWVVEPLFPNEGDHRDWPDKRNGPGIEGVTVTCLEGSDEGVKETDADGSVSFFGTPPLTIRIEKPGYITTETMVGTVNSEIIFPNEWPEGSEDVIRRLGLEEVIASGELILRWEEDEYLPALSKKIAKEIGDDGDGLGGIYACPHIIVRKAWGGRRAFTGADLIHELMHAWQGLNSINPPCDVQIGWTQSEEGQAWIAAIEKDLKEVGPIPVFDDQEGAAQIPLKEIPWESQAMFSTLWYTGRDGTIAGVVKIDELYQLAPNRCQYMEDRFGPPPPR